MKRSPASTFLAFRGACAVLLVGLFSSAAAQRAGSVGHLEVWIDHPALGPYVSPLFWLNAPQFLLGEAARQVGLTGGRGGPGHAIVHLVRYAPGESLWVEQIGEGLSGTITGRPASHYPTLEELRGPKRYGARRIFTVFVAELNEAQFKAVNGFLRNLGENYQRYGYGHPNCADLAADAWRAAFGQTLGRGGYWFPIDLAAHLVNLPRHLHRSLGPLGNLGHIPWRNRTPDQLARQLARRQALCFRSRVIGDLTLAEAKTHHTSHPLR